MAATVSGDLVGVLAHGTGAAAYDELSTVAVLFVAALVAALLILPGRRARSDKATPPAVDGGLAAPSAAPRAGPGLSPCEEDPVQAAPDG